ncbi:restriction endonuclease subunit S [Bombella sp. TMW 2.2543]|uniref:Restriction endonuclease subunit S n=1 Tax=Bombella pluederhausensis TaxID=2967336 RepID=A0ABT3WG13_9PROT|nr:restriction endonuclease subunit S [Bombella pluederhausensis]MCX5618050.1 restriction endonuclease subunit S [Bombella pluederhausensis]
MTAQTWPMVKLDSVTQIISGGTPKSTRSEFWGGDIKWATPKDLSNLQEKYISKTERTLTELGIQNSSAELLPAGSVLFSSRAPIGHIAINSVPMATNQGFKSFLPSNRLDANFLYWWLNHNKAHLQAMGSGATFKELSKSAIQRISIPLPPLSEQKRIAAILDKAYDLCQLRRHALKKLDVLGEAIFHDMFGHIEQHNKNIHITKLENIVDILDNMRRPITKKDRTPGIFPYYGATGILDYVDNYIFNEPLVLLGEDGAKWGKLEKSAYPISGKTWVNNHAHVLKPNRKKIIDSFLIFFLNKTDLTPFISGTTVPKLNQKNTRQIPIPLPPLAEQERFAARIAKLEALQEHHRQALAKQEMLFQSLQQRAFRGEL